jgi:hypothetical protein
MGPARDGAGALPGCSADSRDLGARGSGLTSTSDEHAPDAGQLRQRQLGSRGPDDQAGGCDSARTSRPASWRGHAELALLWLLLQCLIGPGMCSWGSGGSAAAAGGGGAKGGWSAKALQDCVNEGYAFKRTNWNESIFNDSHAKWVPSVVPLGCGSSGSRSLCGAAAELPGRSAVQLGRWERKGH